jgi:hypothetical protein
VPWTPTVSVSDQGERKMATIPYRSIAGAPAAPRRRTRKNPEEDWREVPGTGRRPAFLEVKTVCRPTGIMRSWHDATAYLTGELH